MRIILSLFFLIFVVSLLQAQENLILEKQKLQTNKEGFSFVWRQVKISEQFYEKNNLGGYMLAIEGYVLGYDYNQNYPELNYKLGISYLYSVYKPKSLPFLKLAYEQKPNVAKDILWQLGLAYQYNYEFDSALMYFDLYKKNLSETELSKKKTIIEQKEKECIYAKELVANPANVKIENIAEINTPYPEYCPVITADESKIYFTARRPDCIGATIDNFDGQFYEDIYYSGFQDNKWAEPKNISIPLNTKYHDATVALSPDGNSMLIYRSGDLYICYKKGQKWTVPESLPETINSDKIENSACFSFDGKTIYFVRGKTSDPTISNSDIYVTKLVKGQWTKPERLPDIINSPKDEDGVFIHPDGRTLYFSSLGHGTMGGFDIFKSVKDENGNWTEPVNLGYPINTPDDDIYFVMSADGKTGYYSSIRQNSKGFSDIYKIVFLKDKQIFQDAEDNLIAANDSATTQLISNHQNETVYLTLVTGKVFDGVTLKPLKAFIEIYDNLNDSLVLVTESDQIEGTYIVTLPSGANYGMNVQADNYLFHSENFDLPFDQAFNRVVLDIPLFQISEGSKVILKNIFFDFNKSTLRPESFLELDRLVFIMQQSPNIVVEISGHTDNIGTDQYNEQLSKDRAQSVVDYLISKGIKKERLVAKGYGSKKPIDTNLTEEGRQNNRRVEAEILK